MSDTRDVDRARRTVNSLDPKISRLDIWLALEGLLVAYDRLASEHEELKWRMEGLDK